MAPVKGDRRFLRIKHALCHHKLKSAEHHALRPCKMTMRKMTVSSPYFIEADMVSKDPFSSLTEGGQSKTISTKRRRAQTFNTSGL